MAASHPQGRPSPAPKAPRRQGNNTRVPIVVPGSNGAFVRFRNKEFLKELSFPTKGTTLHVGVHFNIAGDAPILKKMSSIYDSYRIHGVKYHFTTSVSKTTSGLVAMAVDPGVTKYPGDLKATLSANPHVTGPIHSDRLSITVPTVWCNPMLLREVGSSNATPFQLIASVKMSADQPSNTIVGYIEIEYDIELSGLTP